MNTRIVFLIVLMAAALGACKPDPDTPSEPSLYAFERNGESSVSFEGQVIRIKMATELVGAMLDLDNASGASLLEMYRNQTAGGGDANPFADAELNASAKSVKGKVAASQDYFSANTVDAAEIKARFESWILGQANEVFPNKNTSAAPGVAGQISDGSDMRYVNAMGLEYDQLVNKGLVGALMLDQIVNHYLSPAVLDAGNNRSNNDAGITETGKPYTSMERKWDEAYGYMYGTAADVRIPNETIGADDDFLNEAIGEVDDDPDFAGIAAEIWTALLRGRIAIVNGDYTSRDVQAELARKRISEVIGIRAVHGLQQGKRALEKNPADFGGAFRALSEAMGYIYSLQFTRRTGGMDPYCSKAEVDGYLADLLNDGPNGLWEVKAASLDQVAQAIADKFEFTVAEAANDN